MNATARIFRVKASEMPAYAADLIVLSQDAVAHGAQLGWEHPLEDATAKDYWGGRSREIEAENVVLFCAVQNGAVVGTVQLERGHFETSRHRGEVAKLIVHSSVRRNGIARRLMAELEAYAASQGIDLLYLDTRPGEPVEHLYRAIGYTATGFIPKWLKSADGTYRDNVFYFKEL